LVTSVLYERLKVDNMVNVFTPSGNRFLAKGKQFDMLHSVQWQPASTGAYQPPNISYYVQEAKI